MTAWVRKNLALVTACIVVACLIAGGIYVFSQLTKPTVTVSGTKFTTEFKTTAAERTQGLSGRKSINEKHTMLFAFEDMKERCFWMKDMKFSIDIVWLDQSKKVVAVEQNVSPDTYPQNFCHQAQYVVEFRAGSLQKYTISIGDTVIF